mmetsp:Transcript_32835/g.56105  ORF Transcript_32835/g.56105 Transcript_32835/m.56105 type:complete len:313 (-) Transcript_32835:328-1266(-)
MNKKLYSRHRNILRGHTVIQQELQRLVMEVLRHFVGTHCRQDGHKPQPPARATSHIIRFALRIRVRTRVNMLGTRRAGFTGARQVGIVVLQQLLLVHAACGRVHVRNQVLRKILRPIAHADQLKVQQHRRARNPALRTAVPPENVRRVKVTVHQGPGLGDIVDIGLVILPGNLLQAGFQAGKQVCVPDDAAGALVDLFFHQGPAAHRVVLRVHPRVLTLAFSPSLSTQPLVLQQRFVLPVSSMQTCYFAESVAGHQLHRNLCGYDRIQVFTPIQRGTRPKEVAALYTALRQVFQYDSFGPSAHISVRINDNR